MEIVQLKNPRTGRYVKVNKSKGVVVSHKKLDGPYKNVKIVERLKNKK